MRRTDPALEIDFAGLRLRTPIVLAAGTAGDVDEIADALDLAQLGALVTKSITAEPREGNPPWRVAPLKAGMLNAVGLANPGVEAFCQKIEDRRGSFACPVIASVAGFSVEGYVRVAEAFDRLGAFAGVELNVSCPNVHGGVEFGADPAALRELVAAVRAVTPSTRLFIKLPPAAVPTPASIVDLARAAIETGADALVLCNTTPAMAIDPTTRLPLIGNVTGGLSGPAVHPVVVKLIHDAYRGFAREAGIPILGLGGVMAWDDAAQFVLAGATAVGLGTASFADPRAAARITRDLAKWVRAQGAASVADLVGGVELGGTQGG